MFASYLNDNRETELLIVEINYECTKQRMAIIIITLKQNECTSWTLTLDWAAFWYKTSVVYNTLIVVYLQFSTAAPITHTDL